MDKYCSIKAFLIIITVNIIISNRCLIYCDTVFWLIILFLTPTKVLLEVLCQSWKANEFVFTSTIIIRMYIRIYSILKNNTEVKIHIQVLLLV